MNPLEQHTGNPVWDAQKEELKKYELGIRILDQARIALYMDLRYMDAALHKLIPVPDPEIRPLGTDGTYLYFDAASVMRIYRSGRPLFHAAYLHTVLHCLFGHIWSGAHTVRDHLAYDITVEYLIDGIRKPSVNRHPGMLRSRVYQLLRQDGHVITPKRVGQILLEQGLWETEESRLEAEFRVDDHSRWAKPDPQGKLPAVPNQWKELAETMETELELYAKEPSASEETLAEQLRVRNRRKYSYKAFLRKFAVLHEVPGIDMDSFDYIYYCYGLRRYGNVPLIEPMETKEAYRVEDLVIAVDTSMSCRDALIRRFLEETFQILSEAETYHHRVNIHLIQCDDKVQEDTVIRTLDDLAEYMDRFTVRGMGGTDFRPVFTYTNRLLAEKKFTKLKGLIYFTDGYGTYPALRPLYDTAFVFLQEDYRDLDVPPWAMKLILTEDDLTEQTGWENML